MGCPCRRWSPRSAACSKAGKARAWAIVNWQAGQFAEAISAAREQGVPQPCAAQLPYSLVARDWVESPEMTAALESSGAGVVASFVIAGGVLTGKYDSGQTGRAAAELHSPRFAAGPRARPGAASARRRERLAPSALAIAFALANPAVATVLFGATSPAQIAENVTALDVDSRRWRACRRRELTHRAQSGFGVVTKPGRALFTAALAARLATMCDAAIEDHRDRCPPPRCPIGLPQRPCKCIGYREREPGRLQLRIVMSCDEGICDAIAEETDDRVYVRVILCYDEARAGPEGRTTSTVPRTSTWSNRWASEPWSTPSPGAEVPLLVPDLGWLKGLVVPRR